jgi:Grx4 family monothiol glutaredoxin
VPLSDKSIQVKEVTSEEVFSSHLSSFPPSALLIIYFHAPWAAPCKQMSSVLEALASTYPVTNPPTIGFLSVNAEELPGISETYDVTAVPYIVLQRDGKVIETVAGSDAAKVRAAVENHAGKTAAGTNGFSLPPEQKVTKPAEGLEPTAAPDTAPAAIAGSDAPAHINGVAKNFASYAPPAEPEKPEVQVDKDALFKRLDGLVKAAPVMLFMKGTPSAPQCGFSRQVVGLLRERSIRYGFFNILADDDVRKGLKEFSEWPTFPQLYVDGELVGGLDIVCAF